MRLASLNEVPKWFEYVSDINGREVRAMLVPSRIYPDPYRGKNCLIVLCDTFDLDGNPCPNNYRMEMIKTPSIGKYKIGFEQEYVIINKKFPIEFFKKEDSRRYEYYCGVGSQRVIFRDLAEEHLKTCIASRINIVGMNAEFKIGQWEYQIGHNVSVVSACDDLIVSRYLLERISEKYDVEIGYKPVGNHLPFCHINFSIVGYPINDSVLKELESAFKKDNAEHLEIFGGSDERFNGDIVPDKDNFILRPNNKKANISFNNDEYFEDRRPPADVNPYRASLEIIKTSNKVFR